ncbi:MAG: fibronectin type III domain-containing protein, partial [Planctomycetaceae bacterium]|nr:fibronectin type III domain-containing protein [Planctomycetaceae bacterium]
GTWFLQQNSTGEQIQVTVTYCADTGFAHWYLRSWVVTTADKFPRSAYDGFLPPNDEDGFGEGYVKFGIRVLEGLATGTRIESFASIIFDYNDPIITNVWKNTIDSTKPVSSVQEFADEEVATQFTVAWGGSDIGSGIAGFDIYVSIDDGAFVKWLDKTTATSAIYTGVIGSTYSFYSVAYDNVGLMEAGTKSAEAMVTVTYAIVTLDTPVNLRAVQIAQSAVSLQWNPVPDATEYIVQRSVFGANDFQTVYEGTAAKFIDQGLIAGTQYEYRVQAVGSAFTEPIFVTTLASTETDVPIFLDPYVDEFGRTTLTWTDLGEDYTFTIFRQGQMIARDVSGTSFFDANPPASWGVLEYAIRAFNESTQDSARMVTTIAWNANVIRSVEFTGFEITEDGVQLFWDATPDTEYQIMRLGATLGRDVTSGWTDTRPMDRNDYVLMAFYEVDGRLIRTYSNVFTVQWTQPSAAPIGAFANEFQVDVSVPQVPVQHDDGALTLSLDIAVEGHKALPGSEGKLPYDTVPEILYTASAFRAGINISNNGATNEWFDVSSQLGNEDYTHLAMYHAGLAQGAMLSGNHTVDKSKHPFEFIASPRDVLPNRNETEPDKVQNPLQRFIKSVFWR